MAELLLHIDKLVDIVLHQLSKHKHTVPNISTIRATLNHLFRHMKLIVNALLEMIQIFELKFLEVLTLIMLYLREVRLLIHGLGFGFDLKV